MNLRNPEVMKLVGAQVQAHYRSTLVERIRGLGNVFAAGDLTIRLAKEFGFCYGVERAIDLAYAARKVFPQERIILIGEIIHNPEVNEQIRSMGIITLPGDGDLDLVGVTAEDIVIIPAFGARLPVMQRLKSIGCTLVDTTCGDVMSVWKRVRQNARECVTSIIHGKAQHEETKATASRALGEATGHYLIVLNTQEVDAVCAYIRHGGEKESFLARFKGGFSPGFDPDLHLRVVGVANQTTMMRGETEEIQRRIRQALVDRWGTDQLPSHFRAFDTICGATQERQDALSEMLRTPPALLLVIGGYNSSNTSHLAEMGEARLPTYFIRNASKIVSADLIVHYDLHRKCEIETRAWLPFGRIQVGVTAGASCPNNLIEDTIRRLFELRGIRIESSPALGLAPAPQPTETGLPGRS
ncbi:MAG: 4-hydroxy-3-methylbut-2-enyl diphosphate reductase [Planctomycetes bacterium]|nr:4-hydroxy-3-methylbut-2-enyl diphosphate reductase [Planctomycetota bacterium]